MRYNAQMPKGKAFMPTSANIMGLDICGTTKIYRIFPRARFRELFAEKMNALVSPSMWSDPFENAILKAKIVTTSGKLMGRFSFHSDVYGQCWSTEKASDAMWQIYSRSEDAIRVRTTVGQLIDSLSGVHGEWAASTCFIGRVEYFYENELKAFGRNIFKNTDKSRAIAQSLLAKRRAYMHEKEVRLIYIDRDSNKHPDGVYKYHFDPLKIIDQIMVDGRVEYSDFVSFKNEIATQTGFSKGKIKRSLLYREPKGFVVELPD